MLYPGFPQSVLEGGKDILLFRVYLGEKIDKSVQLSLIHVRFDGYALKHVLGKFLQKRSAGCVCIEIEFQPPLIQEDMPLFELELKLSFSLQNLRDNVHQSIALFQEHGVVLVIYLSRPHARKELLD